MILEFRPRAVADLIDIRDYLLEHGGEQSADRVRSHIRQRLERLRLRPGLGLATSHPEIRVLNPTKYPYRIYFVVIERSVVILHVRHTSRKTPNLGDL